MTDKKRVTLQTLRKQHLAGTPITMVTAYDATFARLFDEAGVDALLVGDSLGNVIQGQDTTLPVTIDEVVYHTKCVVRGAKRAMVIADLPFGTYGGSLDQGFENAVRLMKEGGAHSVKLEGGRGMTDLVRRLVHMGIPVMGHLGFTPQSVHAFGGNRVQAKTEAQVKRLVADARALEDAGAWGIVLEMVPASVTRQVIERIEIPTIGIGAGNGTSGQVLVCYDMLGLTDDFQPRFLKRFEQLGERVREATGAYLEQVRNRSFPGDEHSY